MKPDYELAITLTKVNGFVDLVKQAIDQREFVTALKLLRTELEAYKHANSLLPKLESPTFIEFFSAWLPERIESTSKAIQKMESILHGK